MIIRLTPLFFPKIWGGNRIAELYGVQSADRLGECWGVSAHRSASNLIAGGPYQGMTLRELYQQRRALFGDYPAPEFPILMKLIDALADLSVQVHPGEAYASQHERQHGKDECWYVIAAGAGARITIGHNAENREMFQRLVAAGNYDVLLRSHPLQAGDFFYIPAGTLHAIGADTFLLEVSQSSDVTYRVYDYDRRENGKPRELHLDKALDVIGYDSQELIRHHRNDHFRYAIEVNGGVRRHTADRFGDYLYVLIGEGRINGEAVHAGDFLMLTSRCPYTVSGAFQYARVRLV